MDEAEKYKQRLEAIAEKRRLQEEQERAKREKEDERLRLQQLKRKSLRDQWLMEGAPLSPTSLDTLSGRSPLWGFQEQAEKSQSESQQLAEEKEKVPTEVVQMEETLVEAEEDGKEITKDEIVQNGKNSATLAESDEAQVKTNQDSLLNETTISLTNGTKDLKANTSNNGVDPSTQSNGPICTTEVVAGMQVEPGISTDDSKAQLNEAPHVNNNEEEEEEEEEEEGTVVMRAECVMITDEGEDVSENLSHHEGQQETIQSEENSMPKPEESKQGEELVEGVQKLEADVQTQPESEASETSEDLPPVSRDKEGLETTDKADDETNDDGLEKQLASPELDPTASPKEAGAVVPVPVYSENQPSSFSPEAKMSPEGAEAAVKVQDPDTTPGQFQDVPLTDPKENQKTEAGAGEQEPLLAQSKANNTQAAPQGTSSPPGTVQGEEVKTPKHKSCQCCTIM